MSATKTTIPDTFGARVRFFRKQRGLTMAQLAERTGVSKARVQQYELQFGADRETVGRLALALDLEPHELWPSLPLYCRWDGPAVVVGEGLVGSLKALRQLAGDREVVIRPS